jgi:protein-tyrosine phosphatase
VWHIAAIFEQLAGDDALPALAHCTAGKDRTGSVIALVLGLVGVSYEVIAEDYALSATYLQGGYFDEARLRADRAGIAPRMAARVASTPQSSAAAPSSLSTMTQSCHTPSSLPWRR